MMSYYDIIRQMMGEMMGRLQEKHTEFPDSYKGYLQIGELTKDLNYDFVCRELANREGGAVRWSRLFRALCMMELAGEIIAGYFYEQLSGPQFITPAALQVFNREKTPLNFWVNATDPASPCGLGQSDPAQGTPPAEVAGDPVAEPQASPLLPQRRPQNYLSYLDDELALVVENSGRRLTFHLPPDHPRLTEAMGPLEHLVRVEQRVTVERINGEDARFSPYLEPLGLILKGVKDHKQIYLESK